MSHKGWGRFRSTAVITTGLALAACGGGSPPPTPTVVPSGRAEAVSDRLYSDDRAEVDSVRVLITDAETFRTWWDRATAEAGDPKPPLPAVDFQEHSVLLVAAGRGNSGDRIRVDSIGFRNVPEPGGGRREAWFAVVRTIVECEPFPGDAYPLEIVRVPRFTPPIDWIEQRTECPGR